MTRALPFTQAAIRRALTAARAAGVEPTGFTIAADGSITVHSGDNKLPTPQHGLSPAPALRDAREKLLAGG
jgi:hypothetical protein